MEQLVVNNGSRTEGKGLAHHRASRGDTVVLKPLVQPPRVHHGSQGLLEHPLLNISVHGGERQQENRVEGGEMHAGASQLISLRAATPEPNTGAEP